MVGLNYSGCFTSVPARPMQKLEPLCATPPRRSAQWAVAGVDRTCWPAVLKFEGVAQNRPHQVGRAFGARKPCRSDAVKKTGRVASSPPRRLHGSSSALPMRHNGPQAKVGAPPGGARRHRARSGRRARGFHPARARVLPPLPPSGLRP